MSSVSCDSAADTQHGTLVVAADIFGVLVGLDTRSWRAELARISGLTTGEVMDRWKTSRIGDEWDTGLLTLDVFAVKLRDLLQAPALTREAVSGVWSDAVGVVDPVLAPIAARLAREGRLVLASNNNPVHWPIVRRLLQEAGIAPDTPALVSHELGHRKPDPGFYAALTAVTAGRDVVFVDDRIPNIAAAAARGIRTLHHTDSERTAATLAELLDLPGLRR